MPFSVKSDSMHLFSVMAGTCAMSLSCEVTCDMSLSCLLTCAMSVTCQVVTYLVSVMSGCNVLCLSCQVVVYHVSVMLLV